MTIARRMAESTARASTWLGLSLIAASLIILWEQSPAVPQARPPLRSHLSRSFDLVVIDAGHGGQDSGTMANDLVEKEITLDLAHRLERVLQEKKIRSALTRATDSYISLADRVAIANKCRDAVFISLHCNDGERLAASGVETYFAARQATTGPVLASWFPFLRRIGGDKPDERSQGLAGFIQGKLITATEANDRGTKAEQFYVLANARHPAALVETGFLTNKDDVSHLAQADYRERVAVAIAEGILAYRKTLEGQNDRAAANDE